MFSWQSARNPDSLINKHNDSLPLKTAKSYTRRSCDVGRDSATSNSCRHDERSAESEMFRHAEPFCESSAAWYIRRSKEGSEPLGSVNCSKQFSRCAAAVIRSHSDALSAMEARSCSSCALTESVAEASSTAAGAAPGWCSEKNQTPATTSTLTASTYNIRLRRRDSCAAESAASTSACS